MPETLDETYERTLREINKADWEFAHRLFQFVVVASRPLRVEELAELLAFDFKAGPIPKFHEDWRLEDPVDAVLSACSSLLAVVDVEGYPVIQFSHFSVKEFLTSARLAEANDIIHRRYHVSMTPAHTLASQACLGTLLHLDKDVITRDSLKDYPLAEYAAKYWVYHAQFEGVAQSMEDGVKQLFDPSQSHLTVCIWIHDPERPWMEGNDRDERPWRPPKSPLYYAIFWGLHSVVHFLVTEHSQDVHFLSITDYETPLHLASVYGHKQVACLLLEHGANASAQDWGAKTSLHLALRQGHVEVAHMLIKRGANVSARDWGKRTPLHLASYLGHVEVAHMLIERGADVSAQDIHKGTPLHVALRWGHVEVAHMLIECGADVSAQDNFGDTPLHEALRKGDVEVAHMLIERNSDVSAQGCDRETPLHMASRCGYVEVAHMLIKRGADVSARDWGKRTPLHLASCLGHVEVAHMLIERGASVSAQDGGGKTPLHVVSTHSYSATPQQFAEVARILLEYGANVTAQDNDGLTPLDLVSQDKRLAEVAHVLIQDGAGPDAH